MINTIILFITLIASATVADELSFQGDLASHASLVDFEYLVQRVESTSPKILQQKINTDISKAKLNQKISQYYPTINIGATSEYTHKFNSRTTASYVGDDSLTEGTGYQTSSIVSVNYDLFRFGATYFSIKAAKKEVDSALANQCIVSEQVLLELLDTYQKARVDIIKLKYLSQTQELYGKEYILAKRLYDYGSIKKTDLSNYALNIADTLESISQIEEDNKRLLAHLGYLSGANINSSTKLEALENIEQYSALPTFETSEKARAAQALIEQKLAELDMEQKSYFPVFSLYGKYDLYGANKDNFSNSMENLERNGYRIGMNVSWKIFDGFKREADIKTKLLELKSARNSLQEAKRKYEEQNKQLNSQIETLGERVNTSQKSVDTSHGIVVMSDKLHQQGEGDQLGVLKSSIAYYQNRSKEEVAHEILVATKIKKRLILRKESRCTAH